MYSLRLRMNRRWKCLFQLSIVWSDNDVPVIVVGVHVQGLSIENNGTAGCTGSHCFENGGQDEVCNFLNRRQQQIEVSVDLFSPSTIFTVRESQLDTTDEPIWGTQYRSDTAGMHLMRTECFIYVQCIRYHFCDSFINAFISVHSIVSEKVATRIQRVQMNTNSTTNKNPDIFILRILIHKSDRFIPLSTEKNVND